jgi:predicted secreted protein
MKMTFCSIIALAALAGCTTTRSKAPAVALGPNSIPQSSITITARDRGTYVALKPKGTLTVALDSNTGAGYQWKLAQPIDASILKIVAPKTNPLPPVELEPDNLTRPIPEQWVFKAVGPGTAKVHMIYSRPDQSLDEAVTYDFTVNAE